MKIDTNMLILLAAGGVGLYFVMKSGAFGGGGGASGGLSQSDMMMMEYLQNTQASADANAAAMMKIIKDMKADSGDDDYNPWTDPKTIMEMAKIGVQIGGIVAGAI